MSRKAIIACIIILAVLTLSVAAAVFFLYSGTGKGRVSSLSSDSSTGLFSAVPADAVMVADFSDLKTACDLLTDSTGCFMYLAGSTGNAGFLSFLKNARNGGLGSLRSSHALLSLHYNGTLVPLLAIDAGRSFSEIPEHVTSFIENARSFGLSVSCVDASEHAVQHSYLSRRSVIFISTSDVFPKSAERHMDKGISILNSDGFADCLDASGGENTIFVSGGGIGKLFTGIADRSVYSYADFFKKFAGWTYFTLSDHSDKALAFTGGAVSDEGVEDFINVFRSYQPSRSQVADVLPSYTLFFASLPLSDVSSYISAADAFSDGAGRLDKIESGRKAFKKESGVSPVSWASGLDIKEVAAGFFRAGGNVEKVLLLRAGAKDISSLFKELDRESLKEKTPKLYKYAYQGFASSVFGSFFSLEDETAFTYIDGWIIVGSESAVSEYVEGRALENTLYSHISDAGLQSRIQSKNAYLISYLSLSEEPEVLKRVFRPDYAVTLGNSVSGYSYVPAVFSIEAEKDALKSCITLDRVSVMKTKAPVHERDTVVTVPAGPFKVKNSATGRTNLFYQQENGYLCLKEETGKGLWAVPFSGRICGNAGTVDYFANGKLQILFASGSSLYMLDRLGRPVNPFPVNLGKEILLGPGIYDFNGTRRYNVMVLHKDNTIDMYNLQGKKPAEWKSIAPKETVKGLPESVKVGGRTFWIVRTSIQTLIYGFYGGEPITRLEGDRMIRNDSKITPSGDASVKAVCYDGKTHEIKLR